jgi:hypothetical protein
MVQSGAHGIPSASTYFVQCDLVHYQLLKHPITSDELVK